MSSAKRVMPSDPRWLINEDKVMKNPVAWATAMAYAVNEALQVYEHLLHWRAETWPDDPNTHDNGWCDAACLFIERFGNLDAIKIPDLYRKRFEQVSYGLAYEADALIEWLEQVEASQTDLHAAMRQWITAHSLIEPEPDEVWERKAYFVRDGQQIPFAELPEGEKVEWRTLRAQQRQHYQAVQAALQQQQTAAQAVLHQSQEVSRPIQPQKKRGRKRDVAPTPDSISASPEDAN